MRNLLIVMVSCAFCLPSLAEAGTKASGVSCRSASRPLNKNAEPPESESQALAEADPLLRELQQEYKLHQNLDASETRNEMSSQAFYTRALTKNTPLLRELQREFDILADLFAFSSKDNVGLPLSAQQKAEPLILELLRESEILRATYLFAAKPEVEKLVQQITAPGSRGQVHENSDRLGRLADNLRQTPTLIPSFLVSDLTPILDALLRDRIRTSRDMFDKEKFSFDHHLNFDLKSVGNFLSLLASAKELPLLMMDDLEMALKVLAISADHQVASHHLKTSDMYSLLVASLKALPEAKIGRLRPRDIFVLAKNLRNLKLHPSPEFQDLLYERLIQLFPEMSFRNLLAINLDLSFAGFSQNRVLLEKFANFYRQQLATTGGLLTDRPRRLQTYFFNSLAGALFNYGVPLKKSDRFKKPFEASGVDIFGTRIFKVQALYLYDYYVHGRHSSIMDLVARTDVVDLARPLVFKPAGKASRLEKRVHSALKRLYPDKLIIPEFPAHPWLPDFDFSVTESAVSTVIFEVQGPYHSRKVFEDPEDGRAFISRQAGNSFDQGKYSILKAMGYRVIELEREDLKGSIDDIAKRITTRLESSDEEL